MRVLVTGADGQLGAEVAAACAAAGDEVVAVDRHHFDIGDRDAVLQAVTSLHPDAIVHCAAWTAVDACETEPDVAWRLNALAVRHIADGARRVGAYVCALSTDYVFDGTKQGAYTEWDEPNPLSVYGRSKLGGEREVDPAWSVVRTSWLCSSRGSNMVLTALALAADPTRELAFVEDQRGSPTFASDLAPAIRRLVAARLPGRFHVTNQGVVSWYELVRDILAAAGHDPDRVRPISTAELVPARPAPRPANSALDNAALRLTGLPLLPHYRDSLDRLVKEIIRG